MSLIPWYASFGIAQFAVGLFVILSRPRRLLNWAVGAHFIFWAASGVAFQLHRESLGTPVTESTWSRIGAYYEAPTFLLVLLIVDQLAVRRPRPRWWPATLLAGAGLVVAYWGHLVMGPTDPTWSRSMGAANVISQVVAVVAMARLAGDSSTSILARKRAAILGLGFGILVTHSGLLALYDLVALANTGFDGGPVDVREALISLYLIAIYGAVVLRIRALSSPFAGAARATFTLAMFLPSVTQVTPRLVPIELFHGGTRILAVALFFLLTALSILRYDAALQGGPRRRAETLAANALLAFAFVSVIAGAAISARAQAPELAGAGIVLVVLVGVVVVPFTSLAKWAAKRVMIDPADPDALRERLHVYAGAVREAAQARGAPPPPDDDRLVALRLDLGLSRRDHELLVAMGQDRPPERLVAYRLALESAGPRADPGSPELTRLREALDISPSEHETALQDVRGTSLTEGGLFLERYRIVRRLGGGGFGEAWLARDTVASRDVVLKRLRAGEARDARAMLLMEREVQVATAVQHPRIVTVHDVATKGDDTFLVMEYVSGGSLADALRKRGRLPEREALAIGLDVLDALAALHERGFVHRDVKPANVLLDEQGRAKLSDFTIARDLVSGDTIGPGGPRGPIGTFPYMPPEQARGLAARPTSDVYALAASLYEAIAGEPILRVDGLSHAEAARAIVSGSPRFPVPHASDAVNDALARALARSPADRFPDAPTMARALRPLMTEAAG